jgi:hypothetical protein
VAESVKRRVNRGGSLSPSDTVGREILLRRLRRTLDVQSVVLDAERRMGKTSLVKKFKAESTPDNLIVYRNLENVSEIHEFVEFVVQDITPHLTTKQKALHRFNDVFKRLGGAEVSGVIKIPASLAPEWKTFLEAIFADLMEHQAVPVYFLWDEIPLMLDNIKRKEGETAAMEILDTLRHLRQTHTNLRMVFTGSVGLHHIITRLKDEGYGNAPINDMLQMDVPALKPEDGEGLALSLLLGESVETDEPAAIAKAISEAVSHLPFYIHHVVGALADRCEPVTVADVEGVTVACLTAAQDPWHLSYYQERIRKYYTDDEKRTLALLDILAVAETPLPLEQVLNLLSAKISTQEDERETMLRIINLLRRDHYLTQTSDGTYQFQYPLIARAWRLRRGLT